MKLSFRNAEPRDWEAIQQLHKDQQKAQGSSYELPFLFGRNIPIALVGVDDVGVIRQCFYCEAVCELRFVGCDPKATALSQRESDGLCYVLKLMGYRWLETYVPRRLSKMIGKPLRRAGFECVDKELAHYTRDLREKL
jgi:hypothetical protein